ncbi:hypothetical protein L3K78_13405 [Oscillospiraceae bacterium SCCA1]|nr:hypothetical protein [Oscillospiraceae bacterium SCCA1]
MSACAKCHDPLVHEIDDSDNEDMQSNPTNNTVPDDVELPCHDHFHWECLLDTYELSKCPACDIEITSHPAAGSSSAAPQPQILVNLNNEGGMQEKIDIFPILQEESYLRAYPEERKCRAFLEFCREGDHRAIIDLLQAGDDDDEDEDDGDAMDTDGMRNNPLSGPSKSPAEILRYQDPLGGMQSGLHAAAAGGHREVAWLLLLIASKFPEIDFPPLVFQEAAAMGVMREDQDDLVDIRSLRDAAGRTAEDVAVQEGGVVWNGWIGHGRLSAP